VATFKPTHFNRVIYEDAFLAPVWSRSDDRCHCIDRLTARTARVCERIYYFRNNWLRMMAEVLVAILAIAVVAATLIVPFFWTRSD
jgi:hypothetical protein